LATSKCPCLSSSSTSSSLHKCLHPHHLPGTCWLLICSNLVIASYCPPFTSICFICNCILYLSIFSYLNIYMFGFPTLWGVWL
jgi:hypothetical protein